MKTLLSLALLLACSLPAFAGHGHVRQQVVVQKVVVQRQRVQRQRFVQQHHVQQIRVQQVYVPQQQFVQPYVQQFNSGCHVGAQQFNAGGCQQLFGY